MNFKMFYSNNLVLVEDSSVVVFGMFAMFRVLVVYVEFSMSRSRMCFFLSGIVGFFSFRVESFARFWKGRFCGYDDGCYYDY